MITPLSSIQIPWYIGKARRAAMAPICIALETFGTFWTVWAEVYGARN